MADRPLLDGITVLDLASVGPAVRAARWLADWGTSSPTPAGTPSSPSPPLPTS